MKIIEEFKDLTCLEYRNRQVKKYPTEAYLLPVKQVSHMIKNRRNILLQKKD